jgi:hypothetical protein
MSTFIITNQTNSPTSVSSAPAFGSQLQRFDRGPRRFSLPAQFIEWRSEQTNPVEASNTSSGITFVNFDFLRQAVMETADLPQGWDSGNAGPMSADAIQHAIWLLNGLEDARISPTRVIPTCDDSILIRYPFHDQTIEWEFFSESDCIRVQIEPTGAKSYLEIPADQIRQHI